ncbi:MAG: superoxide dismutase family protein [Rhodoferax sp.]
MKKTLSLIPVAVLLAACVTTPPAPSAAAQLAPTQGSTAIGSVKFVAQGGKVIVSGEVSGLKPNAVHGFHIHDKGDCSSGDGMSAGGHFNPEGKPHGAAEAAIHHAGDLPSLKADARGVATFSFESTSLKIGEGMTDVIGHGLIVHRDPDDFTTQPTGNSGARIACGVITRR